MRSTDVDNVYSGVLDELLIRSDRIASIETLCKVKRRVGRPGSDSHNSLSRVCGQRFGKRGRNSARPNNPPASGGGVQRRFCARGWNEKGLVDHRKPSNASLLALASSRSRAPQKRENSFLVFILIS